MKRQCDCGGDDGGSDDDDDVDVDGSERWADSGEDSDMYDIEEGLSSLNLDPPPYKRMLSEMGLANKLGSMVLDDGGQGGEKVIYCGNGVFVADDDPEEEEDGGGDDEAVIHGTNNSSPSNSLENDIVLPSTEE